MRVRLWATAAGALLVAIAFGAWYLRNGLEKPSVSPVMLTGLAGCDSVRAACTVRGGGLEAELRLGPPVQPLVPFEIALRITDGGLTEAAAVEIRFVMQGMEMGINRYRLVRTADGLWHGRAILPACASRRTDWTAELDIRDGAHRWTTALPFSSE